MNEFLKKHSIPIVVGIISGMIGAFIILGIVAVRVNPHIRDFDRKIASVFNDKDSVSKNDSVTDTNKKANINGSDSERIVATVKQANPAVVSIILTKDVPIIEQYYENQPANPFGDDFFGDFFQPFQFQVPKYREKGTEKKEIGGGSGFFVSSDGLIVTNKHVVSEKDVEYTVYTNDGKKYPAKVIATDPVNDIAVIKVEGKDFTYLSFGDSGTLDLGQTIIVIGNALAEFRNTVSVGVISGLARTIMAGDMMGQSEQLENLIQTDAAINPGNSGGPLLDLNGNVIGMSVAKASAENIGFALPSNLVKNVVESVKTNGKIVRPYLGIRYVMITEELKNANKLPFEYGALVARGETQDQLAVLPGSPADKAGIVENDIILEVDGQKIDNDHSLVSLVKNKKVGDELKLKIYHKGEEKTVSVKLAEMPE